MDMFESTKASLRDLICKGLEARYTSTSSYEEKLTGNHYQSVSLGGEVTSGFRENRDRLFSVFDFTNKTVVDLGCNLGELSRIARRRGAVIVDGYEYDNYFVMLARLITAYNELQRVSFYQKDLTDRASYNADYDVALAFSVFPYIRNNLDLIAGRIGELLIVETHDFKRTIYESYVKKLEPYFPFHSFVASTLHGHGKGRRAVIAFSKTENAFQGATRLVRSTIDLGKSVLPHQRRFFEQVPEELRSRHAGDALVLMLLESGRLEGDDNFGLEGISYWREMMKGYLEYKAEGKISASNSYVREFQNYLSGSERDSDLNRRLLSSEDIFEVVERRFKDVATLIQNPTDISPIRLIDVAFADASARYRIHHGEFDTSLFFERLDGLHRLFWARLLGVGRLNARFEIGENTGKSSEYLESLENMSSVVSGSVSVER